MRLTESERELYVGRWYFLGAVKGAVNFSTVGGETLHIVTSINFRRVSPVTLPGPLLDVTPSCCKITQQSMTSDPDCHISSDSVETSAISRSALTFRNKATKIGNYFWPVFYGPGHKLHFQEVPRGEKWPFSENGFWLHG